MLKTLAFIVRRADVARDAFREHYETVHAPLALPLLDGLQRYVRHHVREPIYGEIGFDCMTSFWWADVTAFTGLLARLKSPDGEELRRDEQSFMNKDAQTFFPAREVDTPGAAGTVSNLLVAVRRSERSDRKEFVTAYEEEELPALVGDGTGHRISLHHRSLSMGVEPAAFDCVDLLRDDAGVAADRLRSWSEALAAQGHTVVAARVSEHESAIPQPARLDDVR